MGHPQPPVAAAAPSVVSFKQRKWLPTLAVFVVIVAVTLGGFFATGDALKDIEEVGESAPPPAGTPGIEIAPGAQLVPAEGWVQVDPPDAYTLRLTKGGGYLDVLPYDSAPDAEAMLDHYVTNGLEVQLSQLQTSPILLFESGGLSGLRISYVGLSQSQSPAVEGEVTAIVLPEGRGVVFDGWSPQGLLGFVLGDIHQMISGVQVG